MVGSPMPMTSEAIITRKNARNRDVAAISVTRIDMRTPTAASTNRPTMRPMADVAATSPKEFFAPASRLLKTAPPRSRALAFASGVSPFRNTGSAIRKAATQHSAIGSKSPT